MLLFFDMKQEAQQQEQELAPGVPAGLPLGLRNYWYPVLQSEELPAGRPVGFKVLGENLAAWRDAAGRPNVVRDRCPHRSMKLSVGRVLDGELQCSLHGLRFDGKGKCVLIPWETEVSRIHDKMAVQAYPAEELGGYVWAYLGDATKVPPGPLADEVPEELSKPDQFIWFRLPTQVWNANWLLAIDGSDGFHAVTLHAGSQTLAGGGVPLKDRRVKIVQTSHGVRGVSVDLDGNQVQHGHFIVDVKGERFTLPCISTNPIMPAPGVLPYAARLWQFPIDETHTQVVRFLCWRARTHEERERVKQLFATIAKPRIEKVAAEDAAAAQAQGDLIEARLHESLLGPDADVIKVRKHLAEAHLLAAKKGRRIGVSPQSLVYPI
jgi:phenylpropionate dioxygenase-like ring-hydroxylating dioxygenase large terminal subunit